MIHLIIVTRCKAKPDVSPPGYPPSRLCPLTSMHYFSLRPTTHMCDTSLAWQRHLLNIAESQFCAESQQKLFATTTSLGGSKNKFQIGRLQPYHRAYIHYQFYKFGEYQSGRCRDDWSDRIVKINKKQMQNICQYNFCKKSFIPRCLFHFFCNCSPQCLIRFSGCFFFLFLFFNIFVCHLLFFINKEISSSSSSSRLMMMMMLHSGHANK